MTPASPVDAAVVAERLDAQLLGAPVGAAAGRAAGAVGAVVERILAVQAQDLRAARLAVRSRSTGTVAADVDDALGSGRLVVNWLNRGTLHLVRAEDEGWLHQLTAPRTVRANERRLRQEGVSEPQADRGVDVVAQAVTDDGPLTRDQLRGRLDAAGIPTAGQAVVHVLLAASLRGHLVRGPVVGREQAFASVERWLGPRTVVDRDEALSRLAHRYLAGHGPAAAGDLAAWAGLPLGDARRALALVDDLTEQRGGGLVALGPPGATPPVLPPPRLLGPFDPILHGWSSRHELVGGHAGVVTSNGVFRATALVRGRIVATWGLAGGTLTVHPLEAVDAEVRRSLEADGADVLRFLGLAARALRWDRAPSARAVPPGAPVASDHVEDA